MQVSSYARRLAAVGEQARSRGVDAVLVTPGPDLHYLTGYDALPLERLTCLVVPAEGDPVMVVPRLERMAAEASPVGGLGISLVTWGETDDPHALVSDLLPHARRVGLDNHMWAEKVLRLRAAMPDVEQVLGVRRRANPTGEGQVITRPLALQAQASRGAPDQRVEPVQGAGDAPQRVP